MSSFSTILRLAVGVKSTSTDCDLLATGRSSATGRPSIVTMLENLAAPVSELAHGDFKRSRVFKRDAAPFAAALVTESYDIAFADPPYGSRMLDLVIESWTSTR